MVCLVGQKNSTRKNILTSDKGGIGHAKCIIVLWSSESVKSDWVQNEAAEGARRKILVPALIETVEIPFEFRRIQAAHLVNWDPTSSQDEFDEFISSIEKIIGFPKINEDRNEISTSSESEKTINYKLKKNTKIYWKITIVITILVFFVIILISIFGL